MTSAGRRARTAAVGLAVALASGGCGVPASDEPTLVADRDVPYGLLTPTSSTTTTLPEAPVFPLTVCFYRDGLLVPKPRPSPAVGLPAAVDALRDGPTRTERRERFESAVFDPAVIVSATRTGGVALVQLGSSFTQVGPAEQLRVIAQIVCTMTSLPGIGQLAFQLEGLPVDIPRGDGSLTSAPVSRDDYAALLAPPA